MSKAQATEIAGRTPWQLFWVRFRPITGGGAPSRRAFPRAGDYARQHSWLGEIGGVAAEHEKRGQTRTAWASCVSNSLGVTWHRKGGTSLGCIFVLIALFSPRLAVALMWIFTPWVDRAFGPVIWPILGIIFLPLTTLLYVILWNTGGRGVTGWEWIFVILALFGDVVAHSASAAAKRRGAF